MFTDLAGNANLEATVTISYDFTPPTVTSITPVGNDTTNLSSIPIQIVFDEKTIEFESGDLITSNVTSIDNLTTTDSLTYTMDVVPTAEGALTVQLPADAVEDLAGNTNSEASEVLQIVYDATAPTAEISTTTITTSSTLEATITFSEEVVDFVEDSLTITNGTLYDLSTSDNMVYSVLITPNAPVEGSTSGVDVSLALEANKVLDIAGNGNTSSNSVSITFDAIAPILDMTTQSGQPLTTASGPFDAYFSFSEALGANEALTTDDLTVTNGSKSGFETLNVFGNIFYKVTITPDVGVQDLSVSVAAGVVTDAAGNPNAATSFSVTIDTQGPIVTINSTASSPTNTSPIPVTFTFDEEVNFTTFSADDLVAGNFTASEPTTEDNITFTSNITPTAQGELSISLKEGVVEDLAGNTNTETGSFTITYDNVAPTLTITGVDGVNNTNPATITFTFSEAVTGFTLDDISVTNANKGNFSGSGAVYTADITPSGDGVITVAIAENTVTDAAGNANTTGATKEIAFDATRPTVTITGAPQAPVASKDPVTLTFTFSEIVTGFRLDDISVTNATTSDLTDNNPVFTAKITPTTPGTISVSVAENVVTDAAGNGNEVANTSFQFNQKYSGGSGTEGDPYLIATEADLRAISGNEEDFGAHFLQTDDIEMGDQEYTPIGFSDKPFSGTFEGQGYRINNLRNIKKVSVFMFIGEINGVGLFGTLKNAKLDRISLTSLNLNSDASIIGGLVGLISDGGENKSTIIQNCFITGSITSSSMSTTGGLIGMVWGHTQINRCFTDLTMDGSARTLSGFVGSVSDENNEINNSYSVGSLKSSSEAGGIIGNLSTKTKITNSYFAGSIQSFSYLEGIVGFETSRNVEVVNSYVLNSFFDSDLLGSDNRGGGGTGLTTTEMYNKQTYVDAGWNFTDTWRHIYGYPTLRWQVERHNKPFTVSGNVVDENGNPFTAGTVFAASWTAPSKSIALDASGSFKLDLNAGSFYLSVVPTDGSAYEQTYLGDTRRADRSKFVFYDNIYTIKMIPKSPGTVLDGNGRVSGRVVQSAAGGRIVQGRILQGNPLAGVSVMLLRTSDDRVMTTVETDENGDFEITGIPAGEYQLVLGVAGVDINLEGSSFTMDEEGTPLTISAAVSEDGVSFAIEEVLGIADQIEVAVYPNPVQTLLIIRASGQATVRLLNLSGQLIQEQVFTNETKLDVRSLSEGVHLIEIVNENGRSLRKLVKQ